MKTIIKVEKEVNITTLEVNAGVRWWEDAEVDGFQESVEGENIPCKEGDRWKPIIDIDKGVITNWEQGKVANVQYKVCDDGIYTLKDDKGNIITERAGYVPAILCPSGYCCGGYIVIRIDENGAIENWEPNLSGLIED